MKPPLPDDCRSGPYQRVAAKQAAANRRLARLACHVPKPNHCEFRS
jgi:hypothetical protein